MGVIILEFYLKHLIEVASKMLKQRTKYVLTHICTCTQMEKKNSILALFGCKMAFFQKGVAQRKSTATPLSLVATIAH